MSPILSRWGPDALSCGVMQVYFLRGILVALMLALVSVARPAGADAKADCAKAYEASQEQRSSGKLLAAKESLVTCSQAACPSFIKKDCSKWLSDVEGSIPTVVFSARFGSEELSDVKVSVGDKVLAETLDGKALPVDPGTHTFVFESAKHGVKELKFVVKEGAKAQQIQLAYEVPKSDQTDAGGTETGATTASTDQVKGSKTLAYVLMGVGAVGLGGFAYFGLSGKSDQDKLECADSKTCSDSELDPIQKKYLYADIALGVGIVSLGVGTYLLLAPGKKSEAAAEQAKRFRVDLAARPGGGFATVHGRF